MRDIRTMNMATGQQIESLEVMKRLGDLEYRNEGSQARISLIDEGTAVITSGFRVAPSTGMIVTVPTGTLYQRQIDVTGVVQTVAQNITLAVASGSPRIDTIQGQIVSVADKTDYAQIGTVASGGGSVVITNTTISRDIKYYLAVQSLTNTTTVTPAVAGVLTGTVSIAGTVDLSSAYLINISDGEDGSWMQIDCRGVTPAATTKTEIINNINAAVGRVMASISGNYIVLTGAGLGETSYFSIKPPVTNTALDALLIIFGVAITGIYQYKYRGTNGWIKLAEIDVGAATTTITSGMIRNIDQSSTWASETANVLVRDRLYKTGTSTGFSADMVDMAHLSIDGTAAANSDLKVMSEKAVVTYTASIVNAASVSGWLAAGETWTYATAVSPNFTFTVPTDLTGKYSKDMKVRITQSQALTNYWSFDTNNVDAIAGVTMTDIATPTYSAGKFNNGLTLNGSSQALKVADNTFKPTGDFTIGMWVKAASPASMTLFQSFRISTQWSGIKVQTAVTTGYPLVTIAANSGTVLNTDYSLITGKTNVCDNAFHYLVVTYKDNMVKIYVDGALNAFGYSLAPVYNATTYTRIGVYTPDGTTNSLWWAGQIDDLFLINGAVLDEQTIYEKYVAQTAQGVAALTLTKYFTINSVSYTPSTTTISIFGGQDYTLANATISSPYYAMVETPFRMDKNLNKWNLLTYPYRTFLTTGSFVPPAWATKIFYMIQAHGGSGGTGGYYGCGAGGGGAGGILMGFKDIAEFDGNYGITFGTGTNPTYFNAFPTLTATVGLTGIAGSAGGGSPQVSPGAAGGDISGTGVVTFGTGIGGCSGGNSGRSDGGMGLSDGGRGGAGIAGIGGIGGVGDGGNGGNGGYGSGGGGAAGYGSSASGTVGAGGAACAILWFF